MQVKDIILVAPILDISGTAEVARNLYLALFDLGIKVKIAELPGWSHLKADLPIEVRDKLDVGFQRNDLVDPVAIHFYPPDPFKGIARLDARAQFSFTVFETDKCPILWRDMFNNPPFVENWVGCDFHIDAYASQGIDKNKLRVINFGVDSNRFNPNVEASNLRSDSIFTIGTALDWSIRKNPQGMVMAFLQEFNNTPDARFIIKSYTGYGDEAAAEGIKREIKSIRNMIRSDAKIEFTSDYLHYDQMASFHKTMDTWINLSNGEGWDLGSLQSMACGVPVIAADNTSHKTYMTAEDSYLVPCTKVPINSTEFLSKNPNFIGHSWWQADLKAARRQMRQAYNDWKDGKIVEKGKIARQVALEYPWKRTAVKMLWESGKFFN